MDSRQQPLPQRARIGMGAGIGGGLGIIAALLLAQEIAFGVVIGAGPGVLVGLLADAGLRARR